MLLHQHQKIQKLDGLTLYRHLHWGVRFGDVLHKTLALTRCLELGAGHAKLQNNSEIDRVSRKSASSYMTKLSWVGSCTYQRPLRSKSTNSWIQYSQLLRSPPIDIRGLPPTGALREPGQASPRRVVYNASIVEYFNAPTINWEPLTAGGPGTVLSEKLLSLYRNNLWGFPSVKSTR